MSVTGSQNTEYSKTYRTKGEKRGDGSIDRNVSHRLPTKIQGTAKHTTLKGKKRGRGIISSM